MSDRLATLTADLLSAAKKAGADSADALAVDGTAVSIDVRAGALELAERSEGTDIGLRVMIGQRQACVSASDIKPETIQQMAQRAVAMAREAPIDATIGLADPDQYARDWDLAALDLADPADEPAPAALQEAALRAEAAALAVDGVAQVQSAAAAYGRRQLHLATSNGFSGGYGRTDTTLSCVAITGSGTGMERDYYADHRTHAAEMDSPETIGRIAGERTVARAGARQPKTGAYPVLFDERVAASLIGHLVSAINGSAIARGASWLRDDLGEQVLPMGMSLIEDPHRPRIAGSRPFDGEGLPTARRAIVENGTLTGWTLDLGTARKLGLNSTANATRATTSPPSPAAGNLALTQGHQSRDDLLAEMGTGLLVTSLMGSTINPNTGDYSRGASGLWVENGVAVHPVNECTIAGNLRDMLLSLTAANDARPHLSRCVPSLRVEGLTLAGA
ncbi:TldD/PmbA family protein [Oceaniglobus trochenteri]|uniref:TldD/PmbA family protein n=1 Tax=Oceaniglobus trochenteri TaxID=2763260 RepID=UPI001D000577|nr:TldD/PmbA family protein [Oceaniglobus trochenteri]